MSLLYCEYIVWIYRDYILDILLINYYIIFAEYIMWIYCGYNMVKNCGYIMD